MSGQKGDGNAPLDSPTLVGSMFHLSGRSCFMLWRFSGVVPPRRSRIVTLRSMAAAVSLPISVSAHPMDLMASPTIFSVSNPATFAFQSIAVIFCTLLFAPLSPKVLSLAGSIRGFSRAAALSAGDGRPHPCETSARKQRNGRKSRSVGTGFQ